MKEYDPNYNMTKPYIWNFEKELWEPFYPFMFNVKKIGRDAYIENTFKKYNSGYYITNDFQTDEQKYVEKAFTKQKTFVSLYDFKKNCLKLLKDYGIVIEYSDRYKYVKNNCVYVQNKSFSKLPYNLSKLKKHHFVINNNITIVENEDEENLKTFK